MFDSRYEKNTGTIGIDGQTILSGSCAAVIGCGGLGGWIIELLARAGIGKLIVVDGDVFSRSNLNRQVLCTEDNIGKNKSEEAARRVEVVNGKVKIKSVSAFLDEENANEILSGCDIAFDALDSIRSRLILYRAALALNIPVVHGAVAGWFGQISFILPGNRALCDIWENQNDKGIETELGVPPFAPSLIASIQVSEGIKFLMGKSDSLLCDSILYIDMLKNTFDKIILR